MEVDGAIRNPAGDDGFGGGGAELGPRTAPPARSHGDPFDSSRAFGLLKDIGLSLTEESCVLMPTLLSFIKHRDPIVVRQSIITGTSLFCAVLTEMALQLSNSNNVEGWLEEMWSWMIQFKDAVCGLLLEGGSVGTKVLAVKFLEICILLFTSNADDSEVPNSEGKARNFNVSWLAQGHSSLNPSLLETEANRFLVLLLDILQSAHSGCGSLTITVINCLAAIAKNRPIHYDNVLSAMLGCDPNFDTSDGCHAASIRYALRTAFLGFLRCGHPLIIESREKLLRALRAMYPGEATDQIIRQVEKISRSTERVSREIRASKDDPSSGQISSSSELVRMRPVVQPSDSPAIYDEMPAKRTRFDTPVFSTQPAKMASDLPDVNDANNNFSSETSLIDSDKSPTEAMIAMIGALLAEGERGANSLELLISQMHSDLLADIVIETMKHLPESPLALSGRNGNIQPSSHTSQPVVSSQVSSTASAIASGQFSALASELASNATYSSGISMLASDVPSFPNMPADFKRDPRRDPRRLDPRRTAAATSPQPVPLNLENVNDMQPDSSKPVPALEALKVEDSPISLISKSDVTISDSCMDPTTDQLMSKESPMVMDDAVRTEPYLELHTPSDLVESSAYALEQELVASTPSDVTANEGVDNNMMEVDQYSSSISTSLTSEDTCHDLPMPPSHIDLTNEQKRTLNKLAVTRIVEEYKPTEATGCGQARLTLLARLVAQADADIDFSKFLQKHIILDYHHQKGHELAMNVLYHLHTVMFSEMDDDSALDEHSSAAKNYEKFLLAVAKALLDSLPASDKSFSRLLGEAPLLPESALKLLEDLCHSRGYDHHGKDSCDGDRITQGLGAVWSLILGRPPNRQACLDIALKCAVYSQDEVRTKAIRLVANKLYLLSYASDDIEQFARRMLLAVVDKHISDAEVKPSGSIEQRSETDSQETSTSGSHISEPEASDSESMKGVHASLQNVQAMSLSHAQQQMSLFFALCSKKPSLVRLVFDIYGRAPKAVKQSVHRHIPILVRTLGSSSSELLDIISDPPEGCENLIMLVLQIVTEESTPPAALISAVKHLYETKLKDAAILIPMLSSLSKDEVLPIFPRLVDLPSEKFQAALARVLQGSAHTGPALTPVEVLVAIHEINPEKDGVALKKVMDACTACFEQRTVFTQHVLAKSLSHLVEQVPLPLLFMRTVIQAVDAFPTMVGFIMGILSKLVNKQIWKMPKLWVGFLKCASQTQPHSFDVLLQLPPPQLESALNKYAGLRGPLATYANQPNMRSSLSRPILKVLGLVNEQQPPRSFISTSLHSSDPSSSVHGTTLT